MKPGAKIIEDWEEMPNDAIVATQLCSRCSLSSSRKYWRWWVFLVGVKNNGEKFTLDYRETAPKKASRDMYLGQKGNANTDLSQNGRLAVGIPGSVAGFFATLKYCKLPMNQIIQPAIDLAEKDLLLLNRKLIY